MDTVVTAVPRGGRVSAAGASDATNALALEMLPRLGSPSGNAVFSPYSIQAALAMVGTGAAGRTASQIEGVLHAANLAALAASNATLAARLAAATAPPRGAPSADVARLQIANGLWVQSGLSLKPGFTPGEELRLDLLGFARKRLGSVVAPKEIEFQKSLPRTRSGKIMRRLLKMRELGLPEGDVSTLEPAV